MITGNKSYFHEGPVRISPKLAFGAAGSELESKITMSFSQEFFHLQANAFMEGLLRELEEHELLLERHWDADHLCYHVGSDRDYESGKEILCSFAQLLKETHNQEERFAIFKLNQPLEFHNLAALEPEHLPHSFQYRIDLLKFSKSNREGEIPNTGVRALAVVCDESFQSLLTRYEAFSSGSKLQIQDFNPALEIKFGQAYVNFHHLSLSSALQLESNSVAFSALMKSGVLSELKAFNPQLTGTIPLGVSLPTSDLDIVVECADLIGLEKIVRENWHTLEGFQIYQKPMDGLPSLIARFFYQNVAFEIFAQNRPSTSQTAFLHFQTEERLLKLGGSLFKDKILAARKKGLKTEKAFAKVLGLSGDPYAAILALQKLPTSELQKLV